MVGGGPLYLNHRYWCADIMLTTSSSDEQAEAWWDVKEKSVSCWKREAFAAVASWPSQPPPHRVIDSSHLGKIVYCRYIAVS